MQDLIDIALEGGCLAVEDLDRMPVRLVTVPTERIAAPRTVGRNDPSGTSLQSSPCVRRGGFLTVLMLDLTRCPYCHRNAAKTWPLQHPDSHSRHVAATRLNK